MSVLQSIIDCVESVFKPNMTQRELELALDALAAGRPEQLDWRRSVVDLMKLVGLESSLEERRALAKELGYRDGFQDTAPVNEWLHRRVMLKLIERYIPLPRSWPP